MRTLLQILTFVSDHNKYLILSIIKDLVQVKIPIDVDEGDYPLIEHRLNLGSYLADFLFSLARKNAIEGNTSVVQMIARSLMNLDIKTGL